MIQKLATELKKTETIKKKMIVQFTSKKFAEEALFNGKKLKPIGKSSWGPNNTNLFIAPVNNRIAYNCRKLKCYNLISKIYTAIGTVHLISDNIKNGKSLKVLHMKSLIYLFLDLEFDVRNNESDDVNDLVDESYQSSY